MTRKTFEYIHDYICNNQDELYKLYKNTKLTDERFSKKYHRKALSIQKAISIWYKIKNFNWLTNLNFHFLVKILNYNNFFKLSKELKEELKTFKLL